MVFSWVVRKIRPFPFAADGLLAENLRPKSRQGGGAKGDADIAKFTMSARPSTSQSNRHDDSVMASTRRPQEAPSFNVSEIIYYTSDFTVTNIFDNPKVRELLSTSLMRDTSVSK